MTAPTTDLTVVERYDARLHKIYELVKAHGNWAEIEEYYLPVGSPETPLPGCYIEDNGFDQEKHTSGKILLRGSVLIYIRVSGNERKQLRRDLHQACSIMFRLFSDNANGDRATANPSYQYMVLAGFWYHAMITRMQTGRPVRFERTGTEVYIREAELTLNFEDLITP